MYDHGHAVLFSTDFSNDSGGGISWWKWPFHRPNVKHPEETSNNSDNNRSQIIAHNDYLFLEICSY